MQNLTHEVCLIGCGPVGLTLANCLAKSPYINSIALVDKKLPKILKEPYSTPNQRVYSINTPSIQILKSLDAYKSLRQFGIMSQIEVISKQSQSFIHWQQNSAIILQNDQLISSLLTPLTEIPSLSSKIQFIQSQVASFTSNQNNAQIKLANGKSICSQLLVGSDGNNSKVKEIANINTYGWSYNQRALVCTLRIPQHQILNHTNTKGYQIYYQGNVLAVLPLWDNYVSIVWSLGLAQFEHIMSKNDKEFLITLNNVIDNSNHQMKSQKGYKQIPNPQQIVNKRLSFPLSSLQAGNYTSKRIALIGDAAHSLHPMAGLGVNSGLIDSVLLANNIILNKKTGNDIGQPMSLSSFQSQSKSFNYANSLAMQTIKKSFQLSNPVVNTVRRLGMNLFRESQGIKGLMKHAVENNPLANIKPFQWDKN